MTKNKKVFQYCHQVVLFEEALELFPGGELDPAWAVDVDVPAASLLAVFATLELSYPPRWQSSILGSMV